MDFDDLSTVKLSEKLAPYADEIYRKRLKVKAIKRTKRNDGKVSALDKKFCIDVILTLSNDAILTGQEKFRSYDAFKKYRGQATIEFYQDPNISKKGEFFHLFPQLYFWGFSNRDATGFAKYYCVDIPRLMLKLLASKIPYDVHQNHTYSKANFIAFDYKDIPKSCILFKG